MKNNKFIIAYIIKFFLLITLLRAVAQNLSILWGIYIFIGIGTLFEKILNIGFKKKFNQPIFTMKIFLFMVVVLTYKDVFLQKEVTIAYFMLNVFFLRSVLDIVDSIVLNLKFFKQSNILLLPLEERDVFNSLNLTNIYKDLISYEKNNDNAKEDLDDMITDINNNLYSIVCCWHDFQLIHSIPDL